MASPVPKQDCDLLQVVFAQSHSNEDGGLIRSYPATVQVMRTECVVCRWFDPDDEFRKDQNVKCVEEIPRNGIMELNVGNKKYIRSRQMALQDAKARIHWHKCVAEAAKSIYVHENEKEKAYQTRFELLQ